MDNVIDGNNIARYAHEGFIPGGIPLTVMANNSWRRQYFFYHDALRIWNGPTAAGARTDFSKSEHADLKLFLTFAPIPAKLSV